MKVITFPVPQWTKKKGKKGKGKKISEGPAPLKLLPCLIWRKGEKEKKKKKRKKGGKREKEKEKIIQISNTPEKREKKKKKKGREKKAAAGPSLMFLSCFRRKRKGGGEKRKGLVLVRAPISCSPRKGRGREMSSAQSSSVSIVQKRREKNAVPCARESIGEGQKKKKGKRGREGVRSIDPAKKKRGGKKKGREEKEVVAILYQGKGKGKGKGKKTAFLISCKSLINEK